MRPRSRTTYIAVLVLFDPALDFHCLSIVLSPLSLVLFVLRLPRSSGSTVAVVKNTVLSSYSWYPCSMFIACFSLWIVLRAIIYYYWELRLGMRDPGLASAVFRSWDETATGGSTCPTFVIELDRMSRT